MTKEDSVVLLKAIADEIAQTDLVVRCVVRALIQQPGFNSAHFLQALKKEELDLTEDGLRAKNLIKTIVSEVEGYE